MEDRKIFIDQLKLDNRYRALVEAGTKSTTIRMGYVLLKDIELPLVYGNGETAGVVRVEQVDYTNTIATLTEADASTNGFDSLEQLRETLYKIYPTLTDNSRCTIIHFKCSN